MSRIRKNDLNDVAGNDSRFPERRSRFSRLGFDFGQPANSFPVADVRVGVYQPLAIAFGRQLGPDEDKKSVLQCISVFDKLFSI